MNAINLQFYKHKYTEFVIGSYNGRVCILDYRYRKQRASLDRKISAALNAKFVYKNDETIEHAISQIDDYFMGMQNNLTFNVLPIGSRFDKQVWNELSSIKSGETSTYSELASKMGPLVSPRNVAISCGLNTLAIIIPCHRVINSNGDIGNYGGGVDMKERLLRLESRLI